MRPVSSTSPKISHQPSSAKKKAPKPHTHTYLNPQSSHSKKGFHPILFAQRSHLETNNPLEKKISKGFQIELSTPPAAPPSAPAAGLDVLALILFGFVPGFKSVNRCTNGAPEDPPSAPWPSVLIVDPPSVASALEMILDAPALGAVWYESMDAIDMIDDESSGSGDIEGIGVSGAAVVIGEARTVRTDESGVPGLEDDADGWRITVVLYFEPPSPGRSGCIPT